MKYLSVLQRVVFLDSIKKYLQRKLDKYYYTSNIFQGRCEMRKVFSSCLNYLTFTLC